MKTTTAWLISFACLSVLTNLVYIDNNLSAKYINQLSKVYRYILDSRFENTVVLSRELQFLNSYIFLLSIRYPESIEFNIQLAEQSLTNGHVPPASLQMLVENAVKHNRFMKDMPLQIYITEEDKRILVSNTVNCRTPVESIGIGLSNINKRYELLCGTIAEVRQTSDRFEVRIPILFNTA